MIADIDKDGRCVKYQQQQHTRRGQQAAACWVDCCDALSHLSTAAAAAPSKILQQPVMAK